MQSKCSSIQTSVRQSQQSVIPSLKHSFIAKSVNISHFKNANYSKFQINLIKEINRNHWCSFFQISLIYISDKNQRNNFFCFFFLNSAFRCEDSEKKNYDVHTKCFSNNKSLFLLLSWFLRQWICLQST